MKTRSLIILTPRFAPIFSLVLVSTFAALKGHAQESALPFSISIGGQAATAKAGDPFARIDKPVAASAAVEVSAKSSMTIINITPYDVSKKSPVSGVAPAIILLQGT